MNSKTLKIIEKNIMRINKYILTHNKILGKGGGEGGEYPPQILKIEKKRKDKNYA